MPTTEHDRTMSGGIKRYGSATRNYAQMYDVSGAFKRTNNDTNAENYDYVLDGKGNKIYLARREMDNTIYICTYRVPKGIQAEREAYKMRTGRDLPEYYKCAWINEPEATNQEREGKIDIYKPIGTPFVGKDIQGNNKVYANYKIGDTIYPVEIEFMQKLMVNRYEQLLSLNKGQQGAILLKMLETYNRSCYSQRINRSEIIDAMLNFCNESQKFGTTSTKRR